MSWVPRPWSRVKTAASPCSLSLPCCPASLSAHVPSAPNHRSPPPWTRWCSSAWKGGGLGTSHVSWLQNFAFLQMQAAANVDELGASVTASLAWKELHCFATASMASRTVSTVIPAWTYALRTSPKGGGHLEQGRYQWQLRFSNK